MRPFYRLSYLVALLLVPVLFPSGYAVAESFWANRLGGGADDVVQNRKHQSLFKDRYRSSTVRPVADDNGDLAFKIRLDADADVQIIYPEGVKPSEIVRVTDAAGNAAGLPSTVINRVDVENSQFGTGAVRIGRGDWSISIPRAGLTAMRSDNTSVDSLRAGTFAVIDHSASRYALAVSLNQATTRNGSRILITANATNNPDEDSKDGSETRGPVFQSANVVAFARVIYPDGSVSRFRLGDHGQRRFGDLAARDGVYTGLRNLSQSGEYRVQISFNGDVGGAPFHRTADLHVTIDETRLKLASRQVSATRGTVSGAAVESERYGLPVNVVTTLGSMPDYLNTRAEVWGKDQQGNNAVIGWIGGMVKPVRSGKRQWTIPFSFHSEWLNTGDFAPPLSLRRITLTDIDSGDQLLFTRAGVAVSNLDAPTHSALLNPSRASNDSSVSTAMAYGVHPALLAGGDQRSGIAYSSTPWQRDLLFLRGWCSGSLATGHFSTVIRNKALSDPTPPKGETADRRAIQIMNYLGWTPGRLRGIVAHSQGGLVAASLLQNYSYIFADNSASRPPNVVSMGSPYNGSYLGDKSRSTIGRVLREAGLTPDCPTPYDIRKSQNYRWRNTIGWRAKYQIASWYTTHKKPYWYRPRACGFGSSVIRGSDDGVVKPSEGLGFADGGEYDEHYSGHCHTDDLPGGSDQWRRGRFVQFVNDMFHADQEAWQPF